MLEHSGLVISDYRSERARPESLTQSPRWVKIVLVVLVSLFVAS